MLKGNMNSKRRTQTLGVTQCRGSGRKHPRLREAKPEDSLEGIEQWWLREQQIRTKTAKDKAAVVWLAVRGELLIRPAVDGRLFYRLKGEQTEDPP